VQGRLLTTWGDRATSKEAAQKLITTLVDWEVLRSTKTKGHFLLARKAPASIPELQLWLLETLLGASAADEIEAQQLLRLPESFPFTMSVGVADIRRCEGFNIHRQGLDIDMVALRKVRLEPRSKPAKKPKKETAPERAYPSLFDVEAAVLTPNNGTPETVPVVSWAKLEEIGSGDVFEALHSGLTVELISTHRKDLRTCTPDDAIADVIGRNTESYDFLPVVSLLSKNASIIGLFQAAKFSRVASLEGCIREHYAE
jgi:hypothetical protein